MQIDPDVTSWLAANNLVDSQVDLAQVRLHASGPPRWYLRLVGNDAITLGNHIWYREPDRAESRALLAHELVHVGQYRERGVLPFVVRYLWDFAIAGFRYSRSLPLERVASQRQDRAREVLARGELEG